MIIEFTGPSGAGKTFFSSALLHHLKTLKHEVQIGCVHEIVENNCRLIPKVISDLSKHNWRTDLFILPWLLCFFMKYKRYTFRVAKYIFIMPEKLGNKICIIRSVFRKMGIFQYLQREKFKQNIIIVDEGLLHSVHNLFVTSRHTYCAEDVKDFLNVVPLSDVLVLVNADSQTVFNNIISRGEWSPRVSSKKELKSFSENACKLFEIIEKVQRIQCRVSKIMSDQDQKEHAISKLVDILMYNKPK